MSYFQTRRTPVPTRIMLKIKVHATTDGRLNFVPRLGLIVEVKSEAQTFFFWSQNPDSHSSFCPVGQGCPLYLCRTHFLSGLQKVEMQCLCSRQVSSIERRQFSVAVDQLRSCLPSNLHLQLPSVCPCCGLGIGSGFPRLS